MSSAKYTRYSRLCAYFECKGLAADSFLRRRYAHGSPSTTSTSRLCWRSTLAVSDALLLSLRHTVILDIRVFNDCTRAAVLLKAICYSLRTHIGILIIRAYAISNRSRIVLGFLNLLGSAGTAVALVRPPSLFLSFDALFSILPAFSATCCMYPSQPSPNLECGYDIPRGMDPNVISSLKWAIITQENPYQVDSVSAHLYELGPSGCMSPLSDAL